ncbi:TPA: hypothetical protein JQR05_000107 [Shigella flexneri]|nr:hypothetical protein [Escherichia coli]EFP7776042.1 hypothetical protein [Shigella flexneri]EFG3272774.1 hypothetical protein [Escherichia coli]EFP8480121.1 hypothetical protein [Shigella flexneri]EFQ0038015.1 hypothetical protein [Shigella flexneri]
MHTPIGVKPVAGSKEWREAWQKRAFAHISNGYKHIYIAIIFTRDISAGLLPHQNLTLKEQVKLSECSLSYS